MKRITLIATLALIATQAFAQHDEQVTVEGKYRPKVNKVNKLTLQPETPQPSYAFPSSEVTPKETKQKFALDLEKISPTAFAAKNDKLVTPTQNFLMAGIGTRLSPVFLYKHNSMLTKTLGLGVGIKHNSSWLNIKDFAPSGYMNNAFDINVSNVMGDALLNAGVTYNNDIYHYYGVNLSEVQLSEDQIETTCPRQAYNTIGAFLRLSSTATQVGSMRHSGGVNYHYTFDRFGSSDHLLGASYGFAYPASWWGKKAHPQVVKLDAAFDFDSYGVYDTTNRTMRMELNPAFEMSDDFFSLHLGLVVNAGNLNPEESGLKWCLRPDLKGSLYVLDRQMEFYAGVNGGLKMFTYNEIIKENPFVYHLQPMQMQKVKFGFEGGVRTNFIGSLDIHMGVRYRHTDNDPFYVLQYGFVDNAVIANRFNLLYDETKTVSVLADARVKLRNSLTADLGFAYNNCKPTTEEYAWYRPTTEAKLKLTYDFNDKLAFNTSLVYQGGRYAKVWDGVGDRQATNFNAEKLKDVFDLSLGADYKVNDQISAFALLDNVANQKYQLFYNYPVTGIQFFAGVKLRF